MTTEAPISTILTILDPINERAYHALLPNGKQVVAHLPEDAPGTWSAIPHGTPAHGQLSPFDFDRARIAGMADAPNKPNLPPSSP